MKKITIEGTYTTPNAVFYDSYVKIGTGKYAQYFWYKDIRQTACDMNYMELKGPARTRRVYIPAEDMEFVKSYVTTHIAHAKMKESGL